MLEKNKDYIELSMWSYMATHKPGQCTDINITGISPEPGVLCTNNPFDIPCDVVVVPKRAFDRLQADNEHYRELAKQRQENYNLLLEKIGFTSVIDLINYICDPSMTSPEDKTLKEIIDECEEDYISERDKAAALQIENEQLKNKLHEYDPFSDFKELLNKLYSIEDAEGLEWALNHTCGGRGSVNGWMAVSSFWSEKYKTLSKLIGFSSIEEIQDYLTNEAECNTLQEAISKLKDEVKYTCDEWYSANSSNNSWKAAAECNTPKELIEKLNLLRDDISGRSTVIESYKRDIEKWQKATGCKTPEEAKNWANGLGEANGSLAQVILSWNTVTGCSCPRDLSKKIVEWEKILTPHMSARDLCSAMSNAIESYKRTIEEWQKATGYSTPDEYVGGWQKIRCLCEGIYKSNGNYDNLLKLTGYKSEDDIRALLQYGERQLHYSTMRDLINARARDAKFSEATWQDATGCDTPGEARILLEKWKVLTKCETPEAAATWITSYKSACERGNKLAEKVKEWQDATGCIAPEAAKQYIERLKGRLNKIHGYSVDW